MPDPETVYASPGIFSINVYSYDQPPSDEDEEESDEGDEDEDEEIEFDPIITENPELINQDNEVSGDDVFNTPSESVSISGIQSGPGFSVTIIIVILFSSYLIYRIIKKEE